MDKINKFFYINLSHRNDRKELIEKELQKLEIPQEKIFRFDAIKDSYGALGCAKSHFELVKIFLESDDEVWSIMEDDITFLTNREIIDIYVNDYLNDNNAHFFNGSVTYLQKTDYSKNLDRIITGYCAAWYILKKEHSSIIFDSMKESAVGLSERKKFEDHACDVVWKRYYNTHNFVTPDKLICIQRPSVSDILKTEADYIHLYTNIENIKFVSPLLMGGLGNQMFMIANAYAYSLRTKSNFLLEDKIHYGNRHLYFNNLLINLNKYMGNMPNSLRVSEQSFHYNVIPEEFSKQHMYLFGYFQSEKYFGDFVSEIKNLFKLPESLESYTETKLKSMNLNKEDVTVALHIRRSDYLNLQDIHPVQTLEYYENGKKILEEQLGFKPTYLYFSDDKNWVKENFLFGSEGFGDQIIECENDYEEFALLQKCDHYIIANSSFSWWGSWLSSKNSDKIIIAPEKWFGPGGPQDYYDIYTEHMIKIF
jgi:GR25 family glycosyltransferase involved in LPS biosynthesis